MIFTATKKTQKVNEDGTVTERWVTGAESHHTVERELRNTMNQIA
jgi:hypothetical protein